MRRPKAVPVTAYPQHDAEVLDGLRLRYIDVGDRDATPLLLIHGLASRIEEYEELVTRLTSQSQKDGEPRRIIVLDLPGNGYSDKPDRPYTLSFFEDSVLGFLDAIHVKEAALGGGSLGGNLTLRLGHREPERFTRLAAWAPAGVWDPTYRWMFLAHVVKWLVPFWPMMWIQSRFWYRKEWPGRETALRNAFAHYREVMSRGFLRMYFELGVEQARHSLFPLAPKITQPTLLGWGDQDHALGMGIGVKRLATILPNARLHVFPGARHSLANEVPHELADRIHEFLLEHKKSPDDIAA